MQSGRDMDSNEEYLDQLLKSLTEGNSFDGEDADDSDDGIGDLLNQFSDEPHSVPEDLISGLLGGSGSTPENSTDETLNILSDEILSNQSDEMPENLDDAVPEIPEMAEIPEMTEIPEVSEILEMPEVSEMPESVEAPEISELLEAEELQETLDIPEESAVEEEPLSDVSESAPESEFSADEGGEAEEDDLSSLLESLGAEGDEDVKEISELLDKAERDEPIVDIMDVMPPELSDETEEPSSKKGKRKKKERVKKEKKSRRSKKKQDATEGLPEESAEGIDSLLDSMQQETEEAPSEESAAGAKKQGFWGKLLNTLTQEEEDAEDPADLISDENGAIMEQLDKEGKNKAKGKKNKKADKKGKGKNAANAGEDEDLDEAPDDKKKKKKEKKPKKEKPVASVEELLPGKKLSIKKILPVVMVALAFCAAYVLVSNLYIGHVNKQRAEEAYYAGDYLECYGLFFGQDLNESQALMYHKSELALQMERMKSNYRRLVLEGKELEALDYLVQSVCRREEFYLKGQEWGCLDLVEETFSGLTGLLNANYGLDEVRAMEIAALESDVDYTIALLNVLEEAYSPKPADEEAGGQEASAPYEDLLPEEEEISDTEFVDTIG